MTLSQVRNEVDGRLANFWVNQVRPRQAAVFANRGRYFQGLWTHSIAPNTRTADGTLVESAPDTAGTKPSDETWNWFTIPLFPALLGFRLRIDTYNGPQGLGYVGTVQVRHNSRVYQRSQNEGPETFRTQGWHEVTAGGL